MKITNFRLIDVLGENATNWKFKALVDVTFRKGIFLKRVTEEREVFRTYLGPWYFVDSGDFTAGWVVQNLERMLEAEKGKEIQHCLNGERGCLNQ